MNYEETIPSLPHGFDNELVRTVWIPRNPASRESLGDSYNLDLRPLLIINDQSVPFVVSHIPAWYATISSYAWKAEIYAKVVKFDEIKKLMNGLQAHTRLLAKELATVQHDVVQYQSQVEWLQRMAKALADIARPLVQTFSANKRLELQPGMSGRTHD